MRIPNLGPSFRLGAKSLWYLTVGTGGRIGWEIGKIGGLVFRPLGTIGKYFLGLGGGVAQGAGEALALKIYCDPARLLGYEQEGRVEKIAIAQGVAPSASITKDKNPKSSVDLSTPFQGIGGFNGIPPQPTADIPSQGISGRNEIPQEPNAAAPSPGASGPLNGIPTEPNVATPSPAVPSWIETITPKWIKETTPFRISKFTANSFYCYFTVPGLFDSGMCTLSGLPSPAGDMAGKIFEQCGSDGSDESSVKNILFCTIGAATGTNPQEIEDKISLAATFALLALAWYLTRPKGKEDRKELKKDFNYYA